LNKLRAAIGDEAVPSMFLGTASGSDAADVVPADLDSSPQRLPVSGGSSITWLVKDLFAKAAHA